MALTLKKFQKDTLAVLQAYLETARVLGVEAAFAKHATTSDGRIPQYRKVGGLEDAPYVCLRLPTGGGKTILASHCVRVAAASFLEQDFPVVLWLVPTNTIRVQTLEALSNPTHPYRQALDDAFEGRVGVFDVADVEHIRSKDLTDRVCVVVGTLATLRVKDTDGRRIYAHNENFEPHFARVPNTTPALEKISEGPDAGKVKFSFANLLHLNRPLVIMDEAHNARTKLSFEALQRVSPACIIELTATPDTSAESGSNVLYRVSAAQLKAEDMIKLPIVLTEHNTWQEAVNGALLTRKKLAEIAAGDRDGVRPLLLVQAESKDRPVNIDVLKKHLVENEKVPVERIAVATGSQRELDGINLFDPDCKIEVILTVEALKEGWDCSFAYVFCSVANIRSAKDVEQLLGRVLRMPFAKKRDALELNRAYAHVSSPSFAEAANQLRDSLVAMGFEQEEADQYVEPQQKDWIGTDGLPLFQSPAPLTLVASEAPNLTILTAEEKQVVNVREVESGKVEVIVSGTVTEELARKLVQAMPNKNRQETEKALNAHREYQQRAKSPSQHGDSLAVPRLCIQVQGELEIAEKELFLDANGWSPLDYPAELPEFRFDESARVFEFDVDGNRIRWGMVDENRQLDLSHLPTQWAENDIVRWLDREVRQPDVRQEIMLEFLRQVVASLMQKQKFDLATLVRAKFILAKVLSEKIKRYRQQAYAKGYQETLFGPSAAVETRFDYAFTYDPNIYPAHGFYRGNYRFQKHYYPLPGELESQGEEFECAQTIDRLPQVKYWVRNLANQPISSFWLPTASDRFYPDFVAVLNDRRLLVVEYKGAAYATNDDSKEKKLLGELWEAKSDSRALFHMAERQDASGRGAYEQLMAMLG